MSVALILATSLPLTIKSVFTWDIERDHLLAFDATLLRTDCVLTFVARTEGVLAVALGVGGFCAAVVFATGPFVGVFFDAGVDLGSLLALT